MERARADLFEGRAPTLAGKASSRSRCFWCTRLHDAPHCLSVCPACVAALRAQWFPMGRLEMNGSYALNDRAIDEIVSRTSPGNYALGYMDGPTFTVFYVGRSDSDVRSRLHAWVGTPSRSEQYAPPTRAAWRSDGRLPFGSPVLSRVGMSVDSGYTRFAYSYARSAEAAFDKECRNYRDFGGSRGLDNTGQPVASEDADERCVRQPHERCGVFRAAHRSPRGTRRAL